MPKVILPIANGFYESESLPISAQECVNWYPNIVQTQALSQETLFGTPGLVQLAETPEVLETNRGAHVMAGIPYFVQGNVLYRLNITTTDGVDTFDLESLGAITGSGRVSMADNGTQLCILVPGGDGYIFTDSPDTLTTIVDVDFRANGEPQYVVFIDGYFLFTTDGKKFIISALNDGLSYNALDFGTAEADPDDIVAPIVFKNQLFIGGSETIEAYQNRPSGADFPFVRTGLFIDKGIDSPFSIIISNDTFMFIGGGANESPAIWAFSGNSVQKASTTAIDTILQDSDVSEVFAWSYAQRGAYFVGFTLSNTAVVFDTITQRWHERKSRYLDVRGTAQITRARPNSYVEAYGRILCGDSLDSRVGDLSLNYFTEYENEIDRIVSSQPFQNNMDSFSLNSVELTIESGVGNEERVNPVIGMAISRDGKTFSDARYRSMGAVGEFNKRAIWNRNGRMPRFAVVKFTMSEPVKPVIIQLTADIEGNTK